MPKRLLYDLTGKRVGKWTVLHRTDNREYGTVRHGKHMWSIVYRCRCDCGYEANVTYSGLVKREYPYATGRTTQCINCWKRNAAVRRACSRAYWFWKSHNKDGLAVYADWKDDARKFYDHVGDPPGRGYILRFVDPSLGLVPGNAQWKTFSEAMNEGVRKGQVLITIDGVTMTAAQWAKAEGVSRQAIGQRIKHSWSTYPVLKIGGYIVRKKRRVRA